SIAPWLAASRRFFALRHTENFCHVGKRAARLKRREAANHGAMLATILGENDVNHVVFVVVWKINVNVRQFVQRHAFLIQEAAEVEAETDRAHVGNAEAVANERVRRAATRDPLNAVRAAILQNVPYHQKVFLVTDGGYDAQ